ncbi:MAG: 4Fe-4S dicluster domain-containing protein [candidate division Zixibacteria bacterium]|nr:4Fe-4S dicluster domain-containing protein [candidate division Zixibacteria bacterium]
MGIGRRKFIKYAGLTTVAGILGRNPIDVLADDELPVSSEPLKPIVGKRWAMVVNLKKCRQKEGCHDCIDACHNVHNVPDFGNPKDEVKWIWKDRFEHAFTEQEHEYISEEVKHSETLLFCNHCDNAPCVRVCPTQATWQRDDGIVMMDMHRCIGCRYCLVACPYGSRSFNWRDPRPFIKETDPNFPTRMRGVVEKCNFCAERLAKGQMPACVEACSEGCLVFGDLEDPESEVRELLRSNFTIRRKPGLGTKPEVYYIV